MVADNNDFCEETLDGKNTRAISMDHSQKREHLVIILKKEDLWIHQGPWWRCKRLELEEDDRQWQPTKTKWRMQNGCKKIIIFFLMLAKTLCGFFCAWTLTAFLMITIIQWLIKRLLDVVDTSLLNSPKHHFLLQANANDYNTMDTVMRLSSDIASIFGQPDSAVIIDSATYTKAKQLQLRYPEELKVLVRLGGFHLTLNYLSLLGKLYTSYGLEDLLINSGVYAAGATNALMGGKSYTVEYVPTSSVSKHCFVYCDGNL